MSLLWKDILKKIIIGNEKITTAGGEWLEQWWIKNSKDPREVDPSAEEFSHQFHFFSGFGDSVLSEKRILNVPFVLMRKSQSWAKDAQGNEDNSQKILASLNELYSNGRVWTLFEAYEEHGEDATINFSAWQNADWSPNGETNKVISANIFVHNFNKLSEEEKVCFFVKGFMDADTLITDRINNIASAIDNTYRVTRGEYIDPAAENDFISLTSSIQTVILESDKQRYMYKGEYHERETAIAAKNMIKFIDKLVANGKITLVGEVAVAYNEYKTRIIKVEEEAANLFKNAVVQLERLAILTENVKKITTFIRNGENLNDDSDTLISAANYIAARKALLNDIPRDGDYYYNLPKINNRFPAIYNELATKCSPYVEKISEIVELNKIIDKATTKNNQKEVSKIKRARKLNILMEELNENFTLDDKIKLQRLLMGEKQKQNIAKTTAIISSKSDDSVGVEEEEKKDFSEKFNVQNDAVVYENVLNKNVKTFLAENGSIIREKGDIITLNNGNNKRYYIKAEKLNEQGQKIGVDFTRAAKAHVKGYKSGKKSLTRRIKAEEKKWQATNSTFKERIKHGYIVAGKYRHNEELKKIAERQKNVAALGRSRFTFKED